MAPENANIRTNMSGEIKLMSAGKEQTIKRAIVFGTNM